MKLLFMLTLLVTSCGKANPFTVEAEGYLAVENSEHDVNLDGEVYNYVIIKLDFIEEVRQLCEDKYLESDYESQELYKQEVAICTLDNLSVLDLGKIEQFDNEVCDNPETQEEITICDSINF